MVQRGNITTVLAGGTCAAMRTNNYQLASIIAVEPMKLSLCSSPISPIFNIKIVFTGLGGYYCICEKLVQSLFWLKKLYVILQIPYNDVTQWLSGIVGNLGSWS